ncbi:NACHT and WD repeat domain-containing protein [Azorhizobium sp. AG788]|uniref:NACHT and WD repeat domain-containing protein n=1 Tax=Azorhizobium sp. AG788 TaxID=2183897 RepID=UPI00313915BD
MATGRAVDFGSLLDQARSDFVGRRWLLARLQTFIDAPDGPRILVVVGDPGAGKTSLLAHFVNEGGYPHFFCGRSDGVAASQGGGWSEPIRCAETLGTQLVRSYGEQIVDWSRWGIDWDLKAQRVDIEVRAAEVGGQLTLAEVGSYVAIPRPASAPVFRLRAQLGLKAGAKVTGINIQNLSVDPMLAFQELFLGPLRRAAERASEPIVIVLDGLDEWDRQACGFDPLEQLQRADLPNTVRVVASSRFSYELRLRVDVQRLDLSDPAVQSLHDQDIAALTRTAPEVPTDLATEIVRRANGNFLLAHYLLATFDPAHPQASVENWPTDVDDHYREQIDRLSGRLSREGLRADLGPVLAVVCSAREPLGAATIARATKIPADSVSDLLARIRAFVRLDVFDGEPRFSSYHISFSDFVLSGAAGFGLQPDSGHTRLLETLGPQSEETWKEVGDYAVRHLSAHAAALGDAAIAAMRTLFDDAGYLTERLARLGSDALGVDAQRALQIGADAGWLTVLASEVTLRTGRQEAAGIAPAQALTVAACQVGLQAKAEAFAARSPDACTATPLWSAGMEGSVLMAAGLGAAGPVRDATLAAARYLSLATGHYLEVWDILARRRLALLDVGPDVHLTMAEPDASHVWATFAGEGNRSVLKRLVLTTGEVVNEILFDQAVRRICVSPEGTLVAVGLDNGRVLLLESADGAIVARSDLGAGVERFSFTANSLAALTRNRKVALWGLPALEVEAVALLPKDNDDRLAYMEQTFGLAIDVAGRYAIVGGVDGVVTRLDLEEADAPLRLAQLPGWADHVSLSDGCILAGDATGRVHVLAHGGSAPVSFRAHAAPLALVETDAAGQIVTVSEDGEIGVWHRPVPSLIRPSGHPAVVSDLLFDPDGAVLRSLGVDGSIIEWSLNGLARQRAFIDPTLARGARLTDAPAIVTNVGGLDLRRLSGAGSEFVSTTPWPAMIIDKCSALLTGPPPDLALSQDAEVGARDSGNDVEVWTLSPAYPRLRLAKEQLAGRGALSGDGRLLITRRDKKLWFRSLDKPDEPHPLPFGETLLCPPFWTSQGIQILVAERAEVRSLNIEDLRTTAAWTMTGDVPHFAAVAPDGETVALFGTYGLVELRDATARRLGAFVLRPTVTAAVFHPDGKGLAVGDAAGGVHYFGLRRSTDRVA